MKFRSHFATLLLLVLIVPILAACGGTPAVTTPTTAPVAPTTAPVAPTTAPAATTAPVATTEAATAAPVATEAATTAPTGGDSENFLVYGGSGEPDSLDSMKTTAGTALIVASQILEGLIGTKPGQFELDPALATEWSPNADSTEWTFKLRPDVVFHDGTPFNADAVVFNFQRMSDPTNKYSYADKGVTYDIFPYIFAGYANEPNSIWKNVEKVDDLTVKFTFKQPTPLFPNYVSSSYFGLSSPAAVQKYAEKYGTPESGAVGTGPFTFSEWRAGESVTAVRNEAYWGTKALMPGVVFRIIADQSARFTELRNGSIDFTVNLAPDTLEAIKADSTLQQVSVEPFNIAYLALNTSNKPLDNPLVRQAIAYAINKEAILKGFYGNIGEVATDFLPASLKDARPDNVEAYSYNPAKAKELLAQAGFPDGFDTVTLSDTTTAPLQFWFMPVSRPYFPTPEVIANQIASDLQAVGIKVSLQSEDWAVYLDNEAAGKKNGMYMLGWTGDYADPNNFLQVHFGSAGAGSTYYSNADVDKLLSQASAAKTAAEANALFKQAGLLINRDMPRIPIVHAPPVFAARAEVKGWTPNPTGGDDFSIISVTR